MPLPSAALAQAYQPCLHEAFSQVPLLIQRWCAGLVALLDQRAREAPSEVDRKLYAEAVAALKKNQSLIERGFAPALKKPWPRTDVRPAKK